MNLRSSLSGELRTPDEVRDAVYLFGPEAAAKRSRFWLLLVLAAVIASAGVLADSTATVIGAMIIAPLATPIQGIGVALAGGELHALLASAPTLVAAALAVVAIGALSVWVLPELVAPEVNSQITGRRRRPGGRRRPGRTAQLQQRQHAATEVATAWAGRNGEALVNTHYEGDALVILVEGTGDGTKDAELLTLLDDAVPRGTPVEVNRVPGQRRQLGEVR